MIKTRQGDTWDILALRHYGREDLASALMAVNLEHRKTAIFGAGVELEELAAETVEEVAPAAGLPPWKVG